VASGRRAGGLLGGAPRAPPSRTRGGARSGDAGARDDDHHGGHSASGERHQPGASGQRTARADGCRAGSRADASFGSTMPLPRADTRGGEQGASSVRSGGADALAAALFAQRVAATELARSPVATRRGPTSRCGSTAVAHAVATGRRRRALERVEDVHERHRSAARARAASANACRRRKSLTTTTRPPERTRGAAAQLRREVVGGRPSASPCRWQHVESGADGDADARAALHGGAGRDPADALAIR
jgi:hypothetical protein